MPNLPTFVLFNRFPPRRARVREALAFMDQRGWGRLSLAVHSDLSVFLAEVVPTKCDVVGVDTSACSQPSSCVGVVEQVKAVAPTKPILLLASEGELTSRDWMRASEVGVAELVLDEEDHDAVAIARRIRSVSGISRALEVIQSLRGQVPAHWVKMLKRGLMRARRTTADDVGLTPELLADLWNRGASRAQLEWFLRKDGAWTPGWVVRWLICLRAVSLSSVRPSWGAVASDLGFSRRDDLRAFVRRFAGVREDELTVERLKDEFLQRNHRPNAADGEREGTMP
jgi:hypothetical protein